ncbi:MAG: hypothetical protein PHY33_06955 [Methanobacteriaceae archaeon]|nr:hypothetical protein [Methanobacteriaceae archaeon]
MSEYNNKLDLIYKAMDDATNTIRFIDTKVASVFVILGILIALFISICENVLTVYSDIILPAYSDLLKLSIIIYLISTIISVYYGFKTLDASNNPNKYINNDCYKGKNLWYLDSNSDSKMRISVMDYIIEIDKLNETDLIQLVSVEFMKVSVIRNIKIKNINIALFWMKMSMIFILIPVVYLIVNLF